MLTCTPASGRERSENIMRIVRSRVIVHVDNNCNGEVSSLRCFRSTEQLAGIIRFAARTVRRIDGDRGIGNRDIRNRINGIHPMGFG